MKITRFNFSFFPSNALATFYDDDASVASGADDGSGSSDAADDAADSKEGDSKEGDGDGSKDGANDDALKNSKKTFTQDEVNSILKKERKKNEDRVKTQIRELEELKKSKTMNEQDRAKLQTRIEGLQDELLTKEQLAGKEREKLKKTHEEHTNKLTSERDTWRQRYVDAEITRSIYDAAGEFGAFSGEDIGSLLRPTTQLIEELDESGNATGRFIPKVKFKDNDKEGKPVTLDLTVKEAVKRMKDIPERYGYLFKSTAQSGLGMDGGAGRRAAVDVTKMSPAEYREHRKKARSA